MGGKASLRLLLDAAHFLLGPGAARSHPATVEGGPRLAELLIETVLEQMRSPEQLTTR